MTLHHCFETLGLPSSAQLGQIKKAYRKLALKYHPDRNPSPGAMEKFMAIDEAYDTLVEYKKTGRAPQAFTVPHQPSRKERIEKEDFRLKKEYVMKLRLLKREMQAKNGRMMGYTSIPYLFIFFIMFIHTGIATLSLPVVVLVQGTLLIWGKLKYGKDFEQERALLKKKYQQLINQNRRSS